MTKPQGHVQVLLNILRGYGVQAALDAPRFCISAGSPETESNQSGQSGDINSEVYFEEGIADEVIEKLRGTCLSLACEDGADDGPYGGRDGTRRAPRCRPEEEHVRTRAGHPEAERQVRPDRLGSWL